MPAHTIPPASKELGFFRSSESRDSKYDPSAIGLAFSGGGYRASLYHCGVVIRLNELGILAQAKRIASVSGGSLTTGVLAMNWDKIDWNGKEDHIAHDDDIFENFTKPLMLATRENIDVGTGILGLIPGISAGNQLARSYDKHIFKFLKLRDITDSRRFIFCATNLQSGGLVRMTRDYIADYKAFFCEHKNIKLSEAVAASSGFPPVLAPIRLDLSGETVEAPRHRPDAPAYLRKKPPLVDGGVYDNIGLEPIWKRCGVLFASNAGSNLPLSDSQFRTTMMVRVINAMLDVTVNWRERSLVNMFRNQLADGLKERNGAFWTITTDKNDVAWDGWKASDAQLKTAREMSTRLKNFPHDDQRAVVLAGYSMADATIRKYLLPDATPPAGPPRLL
ncbi:NTE family protein [Litoreibacter ponti]|uniref:NTE family protein n=1 Tax=Litoreibacter ponti TaxID=1510457 RepID=A0A2T6BJ81_9RHOB|nr:patatin-like phospholipase family protein [Litoreibacter ponti]PTX56114.1 NTE family protein [Litoreibacter ponti]